jgi:hypothetical protein
LHRNVLCFRTKTVIESSQNSPGGMTSMTTASVLKCPHLLLLSPDLSCSFLASHFSLGFISPRDCHLPVLAGTEAALSITNGRGGRAAMLQVIAGHTSLQGATVMPEVWMKVGGSGTYSWEYYYHSHIMSTTWQCYRTRSPWWSRIHGLHMMWQYKWPLHDVA